MIFHQRASFALALLLILSYVSAAQEAAADNQQGESDEELFRQVEGDVQQLLSTGFIRNRSVTAHKVERQLKEILQLYPKTTLRAQIEENLFQVQENLGLHDLKIAQFYFNRGHGMRGAEARLLQIVREYPRFSQMDEVFLLLGKVYRRLERLEDATNYLWKLICQHPTSKHFNEAYERLSEIGFDASKGCDNLKP